MSTSAPKSRASRIPATLQAIFLASNRGKDVHKPPPKSVANKVYFSNWLFQRNANSKAKMGQERKKSTKEDFEMTDSKPKSRTRRPLESRSNSNHLSPQVYLDAMLRSRGYSTKRYESLNSAYYNQPTPHQRASYDVHLIQVIRQRDEEQFRKVMSHGLSSNPCNQFSESVAHTVCRHGNKPMLNVLCQRQCDFRVVDDYGRTPLHDACWAAQTPAFAVVKEIVKADPRMFHLIDARGHCPLNYVRKEHYGEWIEFLEAHKDAWWPKRSIKHDGEQGPPELSLAAPNSRPVPDPEDAFSLELASMVASGRMKADQALLLHEAGNASEDMSESEVDDNDDDDLYDDTEYDSESEEDDEELARLVEGLPVAVRAVA